jgi:hypothetical protein
VDNIRRHQGRAENRLQGATENQLAEKLLVIEQFFGKVVGSADRPWHGLRQRRQKNYFIELPEMGLVIAASAV